MLRLVIKAGKAASNDNPYQPSGSVNDQTAVYRAIYEIQRRRLPRPRYPSQIRQRLFALRIDPDFQAFGAGTHGFGQTLKITGIRCCTARL